MPKGGSVLNVQQIWSRVDARRTLDFKRDRLANKMWAVRNGDMATVAPDLFSDEWPEPITKNDLDIIARDLAESTAPLPSFNCSAGDRTSDTAMKAADKRTRIVYGYVGFSQLQSQMFSAMDWYYTYGFLPFQLEFDFSAKMPVISTHDPRGTYYEIDRFSRPIWKARIIRKPVSELAATFPEAESILTRGVYGGTEQLEVVHYQDKDQIILFCPERQNVILQSVKNPLGKPLFQIAERPGAIKARGQFDDVLWVQLARARFALLSLEAADKSVHAPLAVPLDVQELSFGGDEILRSQTPGQIGKVPLPIPAGVFEQRAILDADMREGARFPQARTGEVEGSIVTGKGVQALMGGFDTQIKTGQSVIANALEQIVALALEADEKMWPNAKKRIRGNANGAAYEIEYKPSKDIAGNYVVDVQYGLMAGLDPSRALIFGLQAMSANLVSTDFMRRQMPWSINVSEEEQRIDTEKLRDALGQAIMGYAQAIPMLAQAGQDPSLVLSKLTTVIEARKAGTPMEKAIQEAFPEPPPAPSPAPEAAPTTQGGLGEAGLGGASASSGVDGLQASGLPIGVPEGGMTAGSRPDLSVMLAGISGSGAPNMSARIERRRAV
jgi:hypothetical protein